MKKRAGLRIRKMDPLHMGIVLGIVFLVLGFNYGHTALWIVGFVFIGLGIISRLRGA